ncbi:MAG: excinuclease ABC subunit UvrA [Bacteroidales bacterium]|nr:excinuclease ABC subunit UvrA [Candidatus Liminaster caballi]
MHDGNIYIKGARVNNLKNIDVEIPRGNLVVITGLSGSGKSSLAFDTLYAEGQRRYVESLSSYARQFLGRMGKPECDYILGIPPAVAIQQKVIVRNPRSTVGTSTEIYDYLRLLYARVGKTISPISGTEVKKHTPEDVLEAAQSKPDGTKLAVLVRMNVPEGRSLQDHLDVLIKSGFARAEVNGRFVRLEEVTEAPFNLVIDRVRVPFEDAAAISRFADSVETAFYEGDGEMLLKEIGTESEGQTFSKRFEADGMTFTEPSDMMFNFNSPAGACPTCEGFGKVMGIDEDLVIPNKALSVYEDAVVCWRGDKMGEWKKYFISRCGEVPTSDGKPFPIHKPYYQLTQEQKDLLWHGYPAGVMNRKQREEAAEIDPTTGWEESKVVYGIDDFFQMVSENLYKIQYRVMQARYKGKTVCPTCHGARLKPEAEYVKVGGKSITELVRMPVSDLVKWFAGLQLSEHDAKIAKRLLIEIKNRLHFLEEVGLSYLTLDRLSNSLSGGESQRINLATSLGSALVGSMYILDEPSIGLHSRDTDQLIHVLRELRDQGNTVIVVEHDEEIIRSADYLIDIGPEAGTHGGEVVYQGPLFDLNQSDSYTAKFFTGRETIDVPVHTRPWNSYIEVTGAVHNNLKNVSAKFPLGVMTVVTGVSGSGKSTLVRDILYKGMLRQLGEAGDAPGAFAGFNGDLSRIGSIEFIDQNPIGKSSRSNAATYLKAYDEIRRVFAEQQMSKQLGYTAATFSFNVEGGRCEECKGDGTVTIEMQFMADLVMPCEACHGQRFKSDVLEVKYRDKNIAEVLDMTVDEAVEYFADESAVVRRLKPLQKVGLGYIKLGQSSSTLSGGENQRVKLAYYLLDTESGSRTSSGSGKKTLFIFDEPTTGLHLHDVRILLKAFDELLQRGHTLVIIEHNLDVIKCADHVIDLGPEGGQEGGNLVFQGTPRDLCRCKESYTARYLKSKFE